MPLTISSASLAQLANQYQVDSVALAIIKAKQIQDIQTAIGSATAMLPNSQTVFQAASLSKSVFSYVVFKLLDQRVLELDSSILKYLPDRTKEIIAAALARSETAIRESTKLDDLTVRTLLSHTSGLPNGGDADSIKFSFVPGTDWEYSGVGFQVLQRAVENTTGEALNQLAGRLVFEPLDMKRSTYVFDKQSDPNVIIGTAPDGTSVLPNFPLGAVAAHSLTTTVEDFGKFLGVLLDDKNALSKITDRVVTVDDKLNFKWGLGLGVEKCGDESFIWQWGKNNGYRAFVMGSIQTGDGFVMLTNSSNGLLLAKPLAEQILPGVHRIFNHDWLNS
jgi:CubicO group peptidase (beta-lactamase class C family)